MSLGHARDFFLKRNKHETQFFATSLHWGHALRRQGANRSNTTDLDFMSIMKQIQIIKRLLTKTNRDTIKNGFLFNKEIRLNYKMQQKTSLLEWWWLISKKICDDYAHSQEYDYNEAL
jgi:hypothetical protein